MNVYHNTVYIFITPARAVETHTDSYVLMYDALLDLFLKIQFVKFVINHLL